MKTYQCTNNFVNCLNKYLKTSADKVLIALDYDHVVMFSSSPVMKRSTTETRIKFHNNKFSFVEEWSILNKTIGKYCFYPNVPLLNSLSNIKDTYGNRVDISIVTSRDKENLMLSFGSLPEKYKKIFNKNMVIPTSCGCKGEYIASVLAEHHHNTLFFMDDHLNKLIMLDKLRDRYNVHTFICLDDI